MSSVFYDHLVNIHELHIEFDRLEIPAEERNELMRLADSTVHHEVFDLVMIELPNEHKEIFLERLSNDPSDINILNFLEERVPGIKDRIKERAERVTKDLLQELKKA